MPDLTQGYFTYELVPPEPELPRFYFYEVEDDRALRKVEIWADGRAERDTVELNPGPSVGGPNLLDDGFSRCWDGVDIEAGRIDRAAFEDVWKKATQTDQPFWG